MTRTQLREMQVEIERQEHVVHQLQDAVAAAQEKHARKLVELGEEITKLETARAVLSAELRRMQMMPWVRPAA